MMNHGDVYQRTCANLFGAEAAQIGIFKLDAKIRLHEDLAATFGSVWMRFSAAQEESKPTIIPMVCLMIGFMSSLY